MQLPANCNGCPLAYTAKGFCPPGEVKPHHKLVVWGEAPGETEGETGYGFTGASGKLLREWLGRAGLSVSSAWPNDMPGRRPEDVAFRNVVLCVRPGNKFPTDEEARECLRRHQNTFVSLSTSQKLEPASVETSSGPLATKREIPSSSPPWIAYGANATRVLTGTQLPILKTRGSLLPVNVQGAPSVVPKWLVSSIHPSFLVRGGGIDNPNQTEGKAQDELKPLLGADARRAIESSWPCVPGVSYLYAPNQLNDVYPPSGAIVSVDIEGANGRPNIVGVSWEEEVAYVFPWSDSLRTWLSDLFTVCIPTFHNAAYDVPELEAAGVTPPKLWWDTINMAALYDPDQPMNLQTQVLSHVLGSIAWKGLINHEKGPDFNGGTVATYRELWTRVLPALQMPVPVTGSNWYAFYNGLDTAYGLALAKSFQRKLTSQGRWSYYTDVMVPLQRPLLEIGNRGMPVDERRVAEHREICKAKIASATALLVAAGQDMIALRNQEIATDIADLEDRRIFEIGKAKGKFSGSVELTKLKGKLRPKKSKNKRGEVKVKDPGVFDPSSNPQRCALLYTWFGLPPVKNKDAKGLTTDETALRDLLSRLERDTIKPKKSSKEEVIPILKAMIEVNEYASLLNTFLRPELR